jgi:hypothetical protein
MVHSPVFKAKFLSRAMRSIDLSEESTCEGAMELTTNITPRDAGGTCPPPTWEKDLVVSQ